MSGCRKICILCQQTSPKRWFGNMSMTSNCDVTNSAHQIQMTTICHWMKPPPWKFSAYATEPKLVGHLSFLLEHFILSNISPFLGTTDNQFGLKAGHSTDQCSFLLKQTASYFVTHGSSVHAVFLDASKAFDRVLHMKLFEKLIQRKVPMSFVRLLKHWYKEQTM